MMKKTYLAGAILVLAAIVLTVLNPFRSGALFKNTEYRYSFRIPKGLRVVNEIRSSNADVVELVSNDRGSISFINIIVLEMRGDSPELPANLEAWVREDLASFEQVEGTKTTLDSVPAFSVTFAGGGMAGPVRYERVYAVHPRKNIVIAVSFEDSGGVSTFLSEFRELLDSFRFEG